jgi:hypothetical protein
MNMKRPASRTRILFKEKIKVSCLPWQLTPILNERNHHDRVLAPMISRQTKKKKRFSNEVKVVDETIRYGAKEMAVFFFFFHSEK